MCTANSVRHKKRDLTLHFPECPHSERVSEDVMADLYSAFVLLLLPLCHLLSTDGWDGSVRWVCCLLPAHPPACGIPSVKVQMDHKYGGRERPGKRNNKLTRWTDDSSGMYAGRTHTQFPLLFTSDFNSQSILLHNCFPQHCERAVDS